jgi:hypothetical protein
MRHVMNSRLLLMLWIIGTIWFFGCEKEKSDFSGKNGKDTLLIPYAPPPDSVITSDQMNAWFDCNPKLDSLSMIFSASMADRKAPDDSAVKRFSLAQDTICAQCGLRGGYAQYSWIVYHLGSSLNRSCYDSVASRKAKK